MCDALSVAQIDNKLSTIRLNASTCKLHTEQTFIQLSRYSASNETVTRKHHNVSLRKEKNTIVGLHFFTGFTLKGEVKLIIPIHSFAVTNFAIEFFQKHAFLLTNQLKDEIAKCNLEYC
jgi:hypothetical protein